MQEALEGYEEYLSSDIQNKAVSVANTMSLLTSPTAVSMASFLVKVPTIPSWFTR